MKIQLIVGAVLALLSATASAANNSWYVGGDIGSTTFKDDSGSDSKTGFGALVGYTLNEHIAFEAAVRRLGSDDTNGGSVKVNALQASVLGILPLANGFSVYGRLGYTRNSLDVSVTGATVSFTSNAAVVGVGAAYQINPHFSVRAEYADLGSNKIEFGNASLTAKISQFNVGLNYAF